MQLIILVCYYAEKNKKQGPVFMIMQPRQTIASGMIASPPMFFQIPFVENYSDRLVCFITSFGKTES